MRLAISRLRFKKKIRGERVKEIALLTAAHLVFIYISVRLSFLRSCGSSSL